VLELSRPTRKSLSRWGLALALGGAACGPARYAQAETVDDASRNAARRLAQEGVASYNQGDYSKAGEQLERAYAVLRVPSIGLWSARALSKLGHWVEAEERYLEVTRLSTTAGDAAIQKKARSDAQLEADALGARIPTVTFDLAGVAPDEVELTIDGVKVPSALAREPRAVNPGAHSVQAKRGAEIVSVPVTVAEGESKPVRLRFAATAPAAGAAAAPAPIARDQLAREPAPASDHSAPAAGSTRRTVGWVGLGLGGAGLALGGITGIMTASAHSSLQPHCNGSVCDPAKQSDVSSYNSLRVISGVSLIGGALLAGTGAALLLTTPSRAGVRTDAYIGLAEVGVRGRF
jgi:hypothetical protein